MSYRLQLFCDSQTLTRNFVIAFVVPVVVALASASASAYTFTSIEYPGAVETTVNGVNEKGHVVGSTQMGGMLHGFVWIKGVFTLIDIPGATRTEAGGINNKGQIVGWYFTPSDFRIHGFLREKDGTFTTIDPPTSGVFRTWAYGISNNGDIVGSFVDGVPPGTHGFVYRKGEFTIIDVPGFPFTRIFGGNSANQIAGTMALNEDTAPRSGFIYAGGVFTPIDEPDAKSPSENPPNTWVLHLDDALRVVGYYIGLDAATESVSSSANLAVQPARGRQGIGKIKDPLASNLSLAAAQDLSSLQRTKIPQPGPSVNVTFGTHGFVLAGGKFTTVDVPDATATYVTASNTKGTLVGQYTDAFGFFHGFIATP
jgi:uncharacterized membrane protein